MYILVGVGDLYTDPQMHTVDQKEYGEANLGTKGMALFFSSHVCGPLCEAIGRLPCVSVCVCVCVCIRACVRVRVRACGRACTYV